MADEIDQRRHWRLMWLSSLQAFSDNETQTKRWLDPTEPNPHFSFVECLCSYFDDANVGEENTYIKELARGDVTPEEIAAVADFHSLAAGYEAPKGDDYDNEAILLDPKWEMVVDAARQAQQRLLPLLSDNAERAALTQPLQWEERNGAFCADLVGSRVMPATKWVAERRGKQLRSTLSGIRRKLFGSPAS